MKTEWVGILNTGEKKKRGGGYHRNPSNTNPKKRREERKKEKKKTTCSRMRADSTPTIQIYPFLPFPFFLLLPFPSGTDTLPSTTSSPAACNSRTLS